MQYLTGSYLIPVAKWCRDLWKKNPQNVAGYGLGKQTALYNMVKICFFHLRNSYKSSEISHISISCMSFNFSSINSKWARTQVTQGIAMMIGCSPRGCLAVVEFNPKSLFSILLQPKWQGGRNRHTQLGAQKAFILQRGGHCRRYQEGERAVCDLWWRAPNI